MYCISWGMQNRLEINWYWQSLLWQLTWRFAYALLKFTWDGSEMHLWILWHAHIPHLHYKLIKSYFNGQQWLEKENLIAYQDESPRCEQIKPIFAVELDNDAIGFWLFLRHISQLCNCVQAWCCYRIMLYPGYNPVRVADNLPIVLHYGIKYYVNHKEGQWAFDKHWFRKFDPLKCPPWKDVVPGM